MYLWQTGLIYKLKIVNLHVTHKFPLQSLQPALKGSCNTGYCQYKLTVLVIQHLLMLHHCPDMTVLVEHPQWTIQKADSVKLFWFQHNLQLPRCDPSGVAIQQDKCSPSHWAASHTWNTDPRPSLPHELLECLQTPEEQAQSRSSQTNKSNDLVSWITSLFKIWTVPNILNFRFIPAVFIFKISWSIFCSIIIKSI